MASIVIPQSQNVYLDPYNQQPFDFNTAYSNVYHSYRINNFYRVVGRNVIIKGLDLFYYNIDNTQKVIATVNPGTAIAALRLIEIYERVTLDLDISSYSDTGAIVVSIEYITNNKINTNKAKLKLSYVDDMGRVNPTGWIKDAGNVIIAKLIFTKSPFSIIDVTPPYGVVQTMLIEGTYYTISPNDNITAGYLSLFQAKYENFIITQEILNRGYVVLNQLPLTNLTVEMIKVNCGLKFGSKEALSRSDAINYDTAHYKVVDNLVYIAGSDLSNEIYVNDVIQIKYLAGGIDSTYA